MNDYAYLRDITDWLKSVLEAAMIRVLWVLHALRLKSTPGLCPPQCENGHIYYWPCRARIRGTSGSDRYSYYDDKPRNAGR